MNPFFTKCDINDRKYIDIKTFISPEDKHPSRYYHMVGGLSNRK